MKAYNRLLVVLFVFSLCVSNGALFADWNEGGSYKMHWPQMPDLTPNGIDVNATAPFVLADDFKCTQDGPITNIHIWGSWLSDIDDPTAILTLSIHKDIPVDPPQQPYSMPGTTLWHRVFTPTEYTMRLYAGGIEEGWMDPPDIYLPPPADTMCFQYNVPIPEPEAFVQTSGTVYWLDVQMQPLNNPEARFGWKTTIPAMHWNDDATWTLGEEPNPAGWTNLVYPIGHPFEGITLDFAFVIEGKEQEPDDDDEFCQKWLQPPDCEIGMDIESWAVRNEGVILPGRIKVADDWLCDGRPIDAIQWWGSYIGHATNEPGSIAPPAGNRPIGFHLTWYTDIPQKEPDYPYSRPGNVLTTNYYPLESWGQTNPVSGVVIETEWCDTQYRFLETPSYEHEYGYYLVLDKPWNEKQNRVYWLSVEAVYPATSIPSSNFWGWKTTSPQWNWNDDAVNATEPMYEWMEMFYPPPGWGWVTNHPYEGLSANMAFCLWTEICPARCTKWSQPPDMAQGLNMGSYSVDGTSISLRADDFVSDGRPITDIHWWGSYSNWVEDQQYSETNPPPVPLVRPDAFKLSWHMDDECKPGTLLKEITVALTNCHEMYYGTVEQDWIPGQTNYEHEFQYYVDLLDPDVSGDPWYETNGVRYWLDIQAVYETSNPLNPWGWKIAANEPPWGCPSVVEYGASGWVPDTLPPSHPRPGMFFDLSFEVTTTAIATNSNTLVNVVFTNMTMASPVAGYENYVMTTGYCGCGKQVLQASTNLLQGGAGWSNLQTNSLPRNVNLWKIAPVVTQRFYRVIQVP